MNKFYNHYFECKRTNASVPYPYEVFMDGKHLTYSDDASIFDFLNDPPASTDPPFVRKLYKGVLRYLFSVYKNSQPLKSFKK